MQPIKRSFWSGGPNCQKVPKMNYAHISRFIDPNASKGNYYAIGRYYSALGSLNFTETGLMCQIWPKIMSNILYLIQNSRRHHFALFKVISAPMCIRKSKLGTNVLFGETIQPIKFWLWSTWPKCQKVPKMKKSYIMRVFLDLYVLMGIDVNILNFRFSQVGQTAKKMAKNGQIAYKHIFLVLHTLGSFNLVYRSPLDYRLRY